MIKCVVVAHAILSGNRRITESEYGYLDALEPYIKNPEESVKLTILQLAHQGKSIEDICLILNRDYKKYRPFVSRTLSEYRRKGILPWGRLSKR
jgi:hypothetical protein